MKIRIVDRLLVFLAGLALAALGGAALLERFGDVPITAWFQEKAWEAGGVAVLACGAAAVLLGLYCMTMLLRRPKGKRGFVLQRTEGGELSISIKAIENLVDKCVAKHEELHVLSTSLENSRDGLVIKLRIGLASGVSIPLVAGALQKQIKQYVTACTGVDVREVKVQVETASAKAEDSPYAVPELPFRPVTEKLASSPQEPAAVHSPVTLAPPEAETPRPPHQRIFGREEAPMNVPAPPAPPEAERASAPADAAPADAAPADAAPSASAPEAPAPVQADAGPAPEDRGAPAGEDAPAQPAKPAQDTPPAEAAQAQEKEEDHAIAP